ncbi:MAG: LTA synthase family protein, partial [Sphingobacteriales bacterium]
MKLQLKSRLGVLFARLLIVYLVFMLCRLAFYSFNTTLIDPLNQTPFWQLFKGSLMFDTVSIIYLNMLFVLLSLLPLRIVEHAT